MCIVVSFYFPKEYPPGVVCAKFITPQSIRTVEFTRSSKILDIEFRSSPNVFGHIAYRFIHPRSIPLGLWVELYNLQTRFHTDFSNSGKERLCFSSHPSQIHC